jgi:hypothetical protein
MKSAIALHYQDLNKLNLLFPMDRHNEFTIYLASVGKKL